MVELYCPHCGLCVDFMSNTILKKIIIVHVAVEPQRTVSYTNLVLFVRYLFRGYSKCPLRFHCHICILEGPY